PGITARPEQSIRRLPSGILMFSIDPTSRIVDPSRSRRPGEYFWTGVNIVPASIAMSASLLTPASKMAEYAAKVTVGSGQPFLGFLAIAASRAHNDSDSQIRSGLLYQLVRFFRFHTQYFLQDLFASAAQLFVAHSDVDHPIAVGHAQPDHECCAEHIQYQLL